MQYHPINEWSFLHLASKSSRLAEPDVEPTSLGCTAAGGVGLLGMILDGAGLGLFGLAAQLGVRHRFSFFD